MERRSFLIGTLAGAGLGVATSEGSRRLRELAEDEAPTTPGPETARATEAVVSVDPPQDAAGLFKLDVPPLGPQPPDGRQVSWAQQGEDLVLRSVLEGIGVKAPTYLDVGAFHPTISSNTYLFYLLGGRGVLVEPNPMMVDLLRRTRPDDDVVAAGIGIDERSAADYYIIRNVPQLNTFSREQAERHGPGAIERVVEMPLVSIESVMTEHFDGKSPDLVSIDVEGLDLQVLQTLDFARFRPAVFCVETKVHGVTEQVDPIAVLMAEHGYVVRGGSFVNTIFVDAKRL